MSPSGLVNSFVSQQLASVNRQSIFTIQRTKMLRLVAILCVVSWVTLGGAAYGQAVPLKLQAVLIKRILLFDRSLPKGAPKVVVVHAADESSDAASLVALFKEVGFDASQVKASEANGVQGASAAYLMPKAVSKDVKDAAVKNSVLTLTGESAPVEKGDVAVGLAVRDGKPQIVVHLPLSKSQNHDLSSELLNLATVIR